MVALHESRAFIQATGLSEPQTIGNNLTRDITDHSHSEANKILSTAALNATQNGAPNDIGSHGLNGVCPNVPNTGSIDVADGLAPHTSNNVLVETVESSSNGVITGVTEKTSNSGPSELLHDVSRDVITSEPDQTFNHTSNEVVNIAPQDTPEDEQSQFSMETTKTTSNGDLQTTYRKSVEEMVEVAAGADLNGVHSPSSLNSVILSDKFIQKIWKIAGKVLSKQDAPDLFPHFTLPGLSYYVYHDASFWTSGFFPGIVWVLYERSLISQLSVSTEDLLRAARKWAVELKPEQYKTDNHDLGFMIMPSFARDHDLTGSESALQVVLTAAKSLATRFCPKVGAIKSWAGASTRNYNFDDTEKDFVVVIDSMMNLDLLYYASEKSGNQEFARIATQHATKTLAYHVRPNHSTYHLVNYDARDGSVRNRVTCQGYAHESTWARGQAWALYGFATVYRYTRDEKFLDAAILIADYFISRVEADGVVYWDFDAPRPGVWDVSAATCASSGLLLLEQLAPERCAYRFNVERILRTVVERASGKEAGDALLGRSTINDNPMAFYRTAEHAVVYADYYFLEAGNRLIQLEKGLKLV